MNLSASGFVAEVDPLQKKVEKQHFHCLASTLLTRFTRPIFYINGP